MSINKEGTIKMSINKEGTIKTTQAVELRLGQTPTYICSRHGEIPYAIMFHKTDQTIENYCGECWREWMQENITRVEKQYH